MLKAVVGGGWWGWLWLLLVVIDAACGCRWLLVVFVVGCC